MLSSVDEFIANKTVEMALKENGNSASFLRDSDNGKPRWCRDVLQLRGV
jgi:hypothetical protein